MSSSSPKKAKKTAAKKAPANHPKYIDMAIEAIAALKERKGSSRQAVLKYIEANFKVENGNMHLKMALKRGVANGVLKQTKGTGASGSFKIAEKTKVAKKPAAKKPAAKKPAAKKSATKKSTPAKKKSTAKKTTPKKKPAAKKSKKPAAKKPVAAKKPAAKKVKKTPKKTASKKSKK